MNVKDKVIAVKDKVKEHKGEIIMLTVGLTIGAVSGFRQSRNRYSKGWTVTNIWGGNEGIEGTPFKFLFQNGVSQEGIYK